MMTQPNFKISCAKRGMKHLAIVLFLIVLGFPACLAGENESAFLLQHPNMTSNKTVKANAKISREVFLQWRSPRFGSANPDRMNNPVWEWLVRSEVTAYEASQRMRGPSAFNAGPSWCFQRQGRSTTRLSDGRTVYVGGEHEDAYDPDFYIYNDVVVRHPDGQLDIYGYPRELFPPTDFHTATLASNQIVIIGGLGNPKDCHPGQTPVRVLDLKTLSITPVKTKGVPPGWIFEHQAALSSDGATILLEKGKLILGGNRITADNIDEWRLHLADWRWERVTERRWSQCEVRRKDGKPNHLQLYRLMELSQAVPGMEKQMNANHQQFEIPSLAEELGGEPDLKAYQQLYHPPLAHESCSPVVEEDNVHRIKVTGVVVRYREDLESVQVTVEGNLPPNTLDALGKDLLRKMSKVERAPCELIKPLSGRAQGDHAQIPQP